MPTWTHTKPATPGWYWYRAVPEPTCPPQVVEILEAPKGGMGVAFIYAEEIVQLSELPDDALWAGPLEAPS